MTMSSTTESERLSHLVNQATQTRLRDGTANLRDGLPAMHGALDGLKIVDVDDCDAYRTALAEGMPTGWSYYFPFLLTENRPGRSALLIGYDEGSVCTYSWRVKKGKPRLDLHCAPTPMNVSVLRRSLERANTFNANWSARVRRIDARDADLISTIPHLRLKKRKSQYLFAPENYAELSGKKLYTVRRNVKKVEQLAGVEVRPFSSADREASHELLRAWRKVHRATHGTAGGFGISRRAIDLFGQLPEQVLRGETIYIDGQLAAFAFGGELRPGLACSFERKSNNDIRGLSFYQLRSLLRGLRDFDTVNDGSDTGRAGLRQLKDSFRPIAMHTEYSAVQR